MDKDKITSSDAEQEPLSADNLKDLDKTQKKTQMTEAEIGWQDCIVLRFCSC